MIRNNDKNKTHSNYSCMMVTNVWCIISIKSCRLGEPYVSIKWLPLVNSWRLKHTGGHVIHFVHFNSSISISLNTASKSQLTMSHQCIDSNRWHAIFWANDGFILRCIYASVDLSWYTLQIDSSCSVQALKETVDLKVSEKKSEKNMKPI